MCLFHYDANIGSFVKGILKLYLETFLLHSFQDGTVPIALSQVREEEEKKVSSPIVRNTQMSKWH